MPPGSDPLPSKTPRLATGDRLPRPALLPSPVARCSGLLRRLRPFRGEKPHEQKQVSVSLPSRTSPVVPRSLENLPYPIERSLRRPAILLGCHDGRSGPP